MFKRLFSLAILTLFALIPVGGLGQDAAELVLEDGVDGYEGTRDTTIYEESQNANGAGMGLFAGFTARGAQRRALIAFDLAGVPDGAQVTEVELSLVVSRTQPGTIQLALHRLSADWGEGDVDAGGQEGTGGPARDGSATWRSNFHGSSSWDTLGGDFAAEPSATAEGRGNNSTVTFSGAGLVADVQAWVDGEADNFGWILIGGSAGGTAKRFHSADGNAPEGQKPRLTIRYTAGS